MISIGLNYSIPSELKKNVSDSVYRQWLKITKKKKQKQKIICSPTIPFNNPFNFDFSYEVGLMYEEYIEFIRV